MAPSRPQPLMARRGRRPTRVAITGLVTLFAATATPASASLAFTSLDTDPFRDTAPRGPSHSPSATEPGWSATRLHPAREDSHLALRATIPTATAPAATSRRTRADTSAASPPDHQPHTAAHPGWHGRGLPGRAPFATPATPVRAHPARGRRLHSHTRTREYPRPRGRVLSGRKVGHAGTYHRRHGCCANDGSECGRTVSPMLWTPDARDPRASTCRRRMRRPSDALPVRSHGRAPRV